MVYLLYLQLRPPPTPQPAKDDFPLTVSTLSQYRQQASLCFPGFDSLALGSFPWVQHILLPPNAIPKSHDLASLLLPPTFQLSLSQAVG